MGKKTYRFGNLQKWKDFNNKKKNNLAYLKCVMGDMMSVKGTDVRL